MAGNLTDIVRNSFSTEALKRQEKERKREENWTVNVDTLFGIDFVKRWSAVKFTLTNDGMEASRGSCTIRYKTGVKTDEGHDILDSK